VSTKDWTTVQSAGFGNPWWKVSGGMFRVLIVPGGRFPVAC